MGNDPAVGPGQFFFISQWQKSTPNMNDSLSEKLIVIAKVMALLGFLILVSCTYYLRSEILALSHIKFSADEVRAASEIKQLRDTYPNRLKQHETKMNHY